MPVLFSLTNQSTTDRPLEVLKFGFHKPRRIRLSSVSSVTYRLCNQKIPQEITSVYLELKKYLKNRTKMATIKVINVKQFHEEIAPLPCDLNKLNKNGYQNLTNSFDIHPHNCNANTHAP